MPWLLKHESRVDNNVCPSYASRRRKAQDLRRNILVVSSALAAVNGVLKDMSYLNLHKSF